VVVLAAEAEAQPAISDATITAEIQAKMEANKLLRSAQITIATSDGKVTLVGSVPNQFARTAALDAARGTPGVVLIDDQLRFDIRSPTAPAQN
jgi:osmotically-inducible protein OsmY